MLCIGSIYAWSIIASELIKDYNFSASQTQIIFGTVIAVFPISMIFVGQLGKKVSPRVLGYISGFLFLSGYLVASYSSGSFIFIWFGIGIVAGVSTGFGYLISLTAPIQWVPEKKGHITGIASAGVGLGAVLMSEISGEILASGKDILQLFAIVGIAYGLIIILLSNVISQKKPIVQKDIIYLKDYLSSGLFKKLFTGIFLGTFAGLLIIGNLKLIGGQAKISTQILVLGVSFFAVANFSGRLIFGFIADIIGASLGIFLALLIQALAIISLNFIPLSNLTFVMVSFMVGLGFGGNFVLFAKETAHVFGVGNLGVVYPYVFLGYAIAGIAGPFIGGLLFDITGEYATSIYLAGMMSLAGSMLFFYHFIKNRSLHRSLSFFLKMYKDRS